MRSYMHALIREFVRVVIGLLSRAYKNQQRVTIEEEEEEELW